MIFCSIRTARKGGTPIRWAEFIRVSAIIAAPPAVRPSWPGKAIDLSKVSTAHPQAISPVAKLLRERHSTRSFDDQRPITLTELSRFLDGTVRVLSRSNAKPDLDDGGHTVRPYPSAGAAYELELYLAVDCAKGFNAASIITTPTLTR